MSKFIKVDNLDEPTLGDLRDCWEQLWGKEFANAVVIGNRDHLFIMPMNEENQEAMLTMIGEEDGRDRKQSL